jgi:beta-fructofuranosidase
MVLKTIRQIDHGHFEHLLSNPTSFSSTEADKWKCGTRRGYEIFCFQKPSTSYIWEGLLTVEGLGKLGLVAEMDKEGNGYFISIDIYHGLVEIRAWGFNPLNNQQNFIFNNIQSGFFNAVRKKSFYFRLIWYVTILNCPSMISWLCLG